MNITELKLKRIEKERKNLLDLISASRERLRVLSIQRENIIMSQED